MPWTGRLKLKEVPLLGFGALNLPFFHLPGIAGQPSKTPVTALKWLILLFNGINKR